MTSTTTETGRERHEFIPTRLGRLAVRISGAGPVAVLWPSMFVDSHTWDDLALYLRERTLVLVDGPGLGRSDPLERRTSIAEAAEAALDLLERLPVVGVETSGGVDWVGNAFGGHIGYELATRPGVLRTFAAISAPPEAIGPALRWKIRMLAPLLRALGPVGPLRGAIGDALLTRRSAQDPHIDRIVSDCLVRPTRRSLHLALQSFILDRRDVTDKLSRILVPTLFVAGDDRGDWSPQGAERAAAMTAGARVVIVRQARTLVPLEQPAALAAALAPLWAMNSAFSAPTARPTPHSIA